MKTRLYIAIAIVALATCLSFNSCKKDTPTETEIAGSYQCYYIFDREGYYKPENEIYYFRVDATLNANQTGWIETYEKNGAGAYIPDGFKCKFDYLYSKSDNKLKIIGNEAAPNIGQFLAAFYGLSNLDMKTYAIELNAIVEKDKITVSVDGIPDKFEFKKVASN